MARGLGLGSARAFDIAPLADSAARRSEVGDRQAYDGDDQSERKPEVAVPMLYRRRTAPACTHLDTIRYFDLPSEAAGCEECLELKMTWVHLRMCQSCGHIGCCDQSEGRHATAHHVESGHPIARSAEPGEEWSWCYVDEQLFRLSRG